MLFVFKQILQKFIGLQFFVWTYLKKIHLKLFLSRKGCGGWCLGVIIQFLRFLRSAHNSIFHLSLKLLQNDINFRLKVAKEVASKPKVLRSC